MTRRMSLLRRLWSFLRRCPAQAPEIVRAQKLIAAIDAGGIPMNTARINQIARDLGLEVSSRASPESTIERIRAALCRI